MDLLLVGFSHKNASAGLRESLARLRAERVYAELREAGVSEAVLLSTCNRFELYLREGRGPGRAAQVLGLLQGLSGSELSGQAYVHAGARAVEHLFAVAAGIDSLVVGETEILGQVKTAYEAARASCMTGKRFNVLFQRALHTGKRVRSETSIAVGQTSVASVAVQLAETIFGDLAQCEVLILGAGAMAEATARHLLSRKTARLSIANRTREKAAALAERFAAQAIAWDSFPQALARVDIVIASTGSEKPVLTRDMAREALSRRAGRSLFVIDIAMPRDVEESVHGLDHVYLYRLEDLQSIVTENLKNRGSEIERAGSLAREKAREFWAWLESVETGEERSLRHALRPEPV